MSDKDDLLDQYPRLVGLNVELSEVSEAAEEAAESGEKVHIAHSIDTRCSDPKRECNLDHLEYYITPDGSIDVERIHTY